MDFSEDPMLSFAERRRRPRGVCNLVIDPSPNDSRRNARQPAETSLCPLRYRLCEDYLRQVRELSANLADRIEESYCNAAYPACSRHLAASSGTMQRSFDLAPWTDLSTLGRRRDEPVTSTDRP